MTKPWLVLDVSYLAYRAFYSLGGLSFEDIPTAVPFGVFRDIRNLQELHMTDQVIFCFDGGSDKRQRIDPRYKDNRRKELTEEEKAIQRSLRQQIYRLRKQYLPSIGFNNIVWQEGYEADDHIAEVCCQLPKGGLAIIVSSDADLYQLLADDRVMIWNPKKERAITAHSFRTEYGISPSMWADVKALGGCPGDGVRGVQGVGEKTAIKFLTGQLKDHLQSFKKIVADNNRWRKNLELVRLPFPGTQRFVLYEDEVTDKKWNKVLESLGITSLAGKKRERVGLGF